MFLLSKSTSYVPYIESTTFKLPFPKINECMFSARPLLWFLRSGNALVRMSVEHNWNYKHMRLQWIVHHKNVCIKRLQNAWCKLQWIVHHKNVCIKRLQNAWCKLFCNTTTMRMAEKGPIEMYPRAKHAKVFMTPRVGVFLGSPDISYFIPAPALI